jgi:hypothetical protein
MRCGTRSASPGSTSLPEIHLSTTLPFALGNRTFDLSALRV